MELRKPMLVISAFVEKEEKFLLTLCGKFKEWRVPGGRLESGEIISNCLKREMKEELGVEIYDLEFLGYGQDFSEIPEKNLSLSRTVLYFKCKTNQDIKPDKKEILNLKWLTIEEIKKHENTEKAMRDLFENGSFRGL